MTDMAVFGALLQHIGTRVALSLRYRTHLIGLQQTLYKASLSNTLVRNITQAVIHRTNNPKMALSEDDIRKVCVQPDAATKGFYFQQTMMRIKDPKASLEFYTKVMGMRLLKKMDFEGMKFSLYFLAYDEASNIPEGEKEKTKYCFEQKATLELTHNWGTENDTESSYHNGNSEPRGFGHIGMVVPDVDAACQRFEEMGVKFIKKPNDGKMKGLAFIQDPDGYWIEILNPMNMAGSI